MGNYRNFKLTTYFVAGGVQNTSREQLEKDLAFFKRHMRLDKVYLEPYRDIFADEDKILMCKTVLEDQGIEVSGGITTTFPASKDPEGKQRMINTFCYNDPRMTDTLKQVSRFLGEHFNEFIIDDFYFTNCTCEKCRAGRDAFNQAHGITDGSWQGYRLDLMQRISKECMIAPAKAANPACSITIKYPNWAESYQETGYNPAEQRTIFDNLYTGTETPRENVSVPDLTGMTITGATKILVDRGLNIILEGATQAYTTGSYAVAINQSIPPYTKVTPGTVVTVEFRFTDARDG